VTPRPPRARAGFTLIELVVGLALTALAATVVAGSVRAAVDARERQATAGEAEHRARVTRAFVREAVRGLATERAGLGDLVVLTPGAETGGSDRLVFATRGGSTFGWDAELKAVELLVDRDAATPHTGLVARVLRIQAGVPVEDTLTLLPQVSRLRVRLLDGEGIWHGEWPDRTAAPAAMELEFEAEEGSGEDRLLALPLRVRVP
jgi:prepilin-type N-terminal cleavage/methylation domain-containing protein